MRLAHALTRADAEAPLLVAGEEGAGQDAVSEIIACAFLCLNPIDGSACGECRACSSFARQVCPDILVVEPSGKSDLITLGQIVPDRANLQPNVRDFLGAMPAISRNKVVLVLRAERFNADAANALLKTLEEPPPWGRFILTSDAAGRIITTVRSRCLIIHCDYGEAEDGLVSVLTGGAPDAVARLSEARFADFLASFGTWLSSLENSSRGEALRISEEFQELAEQLRVASGEEMEPRFARAELVKMYSNWLASLGRAAELASTLWMHRAILGNANFGYVADAHFTGR
jgi:hypothetical protein